MRQLVARAPRVGADPSDDEELRLHCSYPPDPRVPIAWES